MLAISTKWMPSDMAVKAWLEVVGDLGFDAVELNYKVSADIFSEFKKWLGPTNIKVVSVHNFCPLPDDEPSPRHPSNYYRLSSLDEHERSQAVKWTNIAIDTAVEMKSKFVVIHAGTLDFEDERSPHLFALYVKGLADTDEFLQERTRILKLRDEKKGLHIDALVKSLKNVTTYARDQGIIIGLETRYYPMEIPNFEEIEFFLNLFDSSVMGYWHDFGHAEMISRLGITPHTRFLDTYQDRLIGVHIHGIKSRRDHLAPFDGDMDFDQFMPYLKPHIIRVVESNPGASKELIREAVKKLRTSS